jgi:hypothetical protein
MMANILTEPSALNGSRSIMIAIREKILYRLLNRLSAALTAVFRNCENIRINHPG